MPEDTTCQQRTLFAEASLALIFPWLDAVRDWLASGADCGTSLNELLGRLSLSGFSSKMCLAFYPVAVVERALLLATDSPNTISELDMLATALSAARGNDYVRLIEDAITPESFLGWCGSAIAVDQGFLTLNLPEGVRCTAMSSETDQCRNDAGGSSLSRILETGTIPVKYFLSSRAAAGILRRAAKRGRTLPTRLQQALEALATGMETPVTQPTSPPRSTAAATTADSGPSRAST